MPLENLAIYHTGISGIASVKGGIRPVKKYKESHAPTVKSTEMYIGM